MNIKFYKSKDWKTAGLPAYFLVDIDSEYTHPFSGQKLMTSYAPIGQHSDLDPEYLKNCLEITKEEYIKASGDVFTPYQYLLTREEIEEIVKQGLNDIVQKINTQTGITVEDMYYGDEEDMLEIEENLINTLFNVYTR